MNRNVLIKYAILTVGTLVLASGLYAEYEFKIINRIYKLIKTKRPSVALLSPENNYQLVSENSHINTIILKLPKGPLNKKTVNSSTVYLTEKATGVVVPSKVFVTRAGKGIKLIPDTPLKLNTSYVFYITKDVEDISGVRFDPYTATFTTGSISTSEMLKVKFDRIRLQNALGTFSSMTFGPDGKLYALNIEGIINRFPVHTDGSLGDPELFYALQDASGKRQKRLCIGFAFDPSSTADNLVAYITHSTFAFNDGPDWDGKLTRLNGPKLEHVQDILVNLPRSSKDHLTNSIAFGPDGALYFTQGSNTALGNPDKTWSYRKEHLLSAALLRLDLSKLDALPLDVKTADGGGVYDPHALGAPLTIYATGIRNAYDLVWHSNGALYVPNNGSAPGGNTPASVMGILRPCGTKYNGPEIPALTKVRQVQKDLLYKVEKGGYYGHPNPSRGEYVLNGGNPTDSVDPAQVNAYPVGTRPDANWRGYVFDFHNNKSANGIIEYQSNTFKGALKGKLIITRYTTNDIIALTPCPNSRNIRSSVESSAIEGFSGFALPLDIVEDTTTGNIYVSEYGGGGINLLRPKIDIE